MTKHGRVARHMKTDSPVKHKNTRIQRKTKLIDRQSKTAAVIFQPRSLQKNPETLVILRRRKEAICETLEILNAIEKGKLSHKCIDSSKQALSLILLRDQHVKNSLSRSTDEILLPLAKPLISRS